MSDFVKRAEGLVCAELSENLSGWPRDMIERLAIECVRIVEGQRAAAGYHVVQEGQAVVDGRVWTVEPHNYAKPSVSGTRLPIYRLRPLTDKAQS